MIAKKYRLPENTVGRVLKKGKPFFGRVFTCIISPNRNGHNRFAIVIGNKHTKSAVTRNDHRRRMYDVCTLQKEEQIMGDEGFYDFVWVCKKGVKLEKEEEMYQKIEDDMQFCFSKVKKLAYEELGRKVSKKSK